MNFTDLPNDILYKIFRILDIPTRLKLRVNKRLDRFQKSVPNDIDAIGVTVSAFSACWKFREVHPASPFLLGFKLASSLKFLL